MRTTDQLEWLKYYLPLKWTFTTRYTSFMNIISFFIIDAFPSFCFVFIFNDFSIKMLFSYALAFLVTFCIYECGYIFNEIICTRYEKHPTIRIDEAYWNQIPRHLENLLTLRFVIAFFGSWWLVQTYPTYYMLYLLCIVGLIVIYSIHNYYRGFINIFTMAADVSFKYLIPMALFLTEQELLVAYITIFFSIIFVRSLEYISKKHFIRGFNAIRDVDTFRLKYYIVLNLTFIILSSFELIPWYICILSLFFLLYRIGTYYIMKRPNKLSAKINNNREKHGTLSGHSTK